MRVRAARGIVLELLLHRIALQARHLMFTATADIPMVIIQHLADL